MIAHLHRNLAVNALVALISSFALMLAMPPRAAAREGTVDSGTKLLPVIVIRIQDVDGKPLPNVTVVCVGSATNAVLNGIDIRGGGERVQTDSQGWCSLQVSAENHLVLVATDQGFGMAQSRDLTNKMTIVAQPWARVKGVRTNRGLPLANARLFWKINWRCVGLEISDRLETQAIAITDSQGRFEMEHVPPTELELFEVHEPSENLSVRLSWLEVNPGEAKQVSLGTQGRTVIGRLKLDDGLSNSGIVLASFFGGLGTDLKGQRLAIPPLPKEFDTSGSRIKWWHDYWFNTEAGRLFNEVSSRGRLFDVQSDGSFRTEMVAPGKYTVSGSIQQNKKRVAMVDEVSIVVPQAGASDEDAPFDIGPLILKPAVNLKTGDAAPNFSAKTLDGQPLRLSDFRGKFVLLDFWATWCGPCVAEMPNLKSVNDAFGKDERFVMISLSLDSEPDAPKKFVRTRDIAWTQAFLGDWSKDTVTPGYGVYAIPQIFLIAPDGRIVARNLRGPKIKTAVASALGL